MLSDDTTDDTTNRYFEFTDETERFFDQVGLESLLVYNSKSIVQFGELFRYIIERAGLSQTALCEQAIALKKELIERGYLTEDTPVGSLVQKSLSDCLTAKRRPSFIQLFIWIRVIKLHYANENIQRVVYQLTNRKLTWDRDAEERLYILAGYTDPINLDHAAAITEAEIRAAPSLINHSERNFKKSARERDTDTNILRPTFNPPKRPTQ
jgi:hypothetical protein